MSSTRRSDNPSKKWQWIARHSNLHTPWAQQPVHMMAHYIQPEVEEIREEPTAGEWVELVLGLREGTVQEVWEQVENLSGEVKAELAFNMLFIEIPETSVDELCELPEVLSVEFNEGLSPLESGNREPRLREI